MQTLEAESLRIEQSNPVLRRQRQASKWRELQASGVSPEVPTYERYVSTAIRNQAEKLMQWSAHPPSNFFDPALLTEAHEAIFKGLHPWAGQPRKQDTSITGLMNVPPAQIKLATAVMERQQQDIRPATDYEACQKIAAFHLQAAGLRPFVDGNARAARLVLGMQIHH